VGYDRSRGEFALSQDRLQATQSHEKEMLMVDVIDMLERMGSDAGMRDAPRQELERALNAGQINEPVREAILSGDRAAVQSLMGTGPQFSVVMPGVEEEASNSTF
jgi:hypothetical protein